MKRPQAWDITLRCRLWNLSVCPNSGYFRAKIAQEKLIKGSSIPYSIVRATQFFEFIEQHRRHFHRGQQGPSATSALIQPMAADDVASAVARSR